MLQINVIQSLVIFKSDFLCLDQSRWHKGFKSPTNLMSTTSIHVSLVINSMSNKFSMEIQIIITTAMILFVIKVDQLVNKICNLNIKKTHPQSLVVHSLNEIQPHSHITLQLNISSKIPLNYTTKTKSFHIKQEY